VADSSKDAALIILPLPIRRVVRRITGQTHRFNIKLKPASVGRDEFGNLLIDPTNRNLSQFVALEGRTQQTTFKMQNDGKIIHIARAHLLNL